MQLCREFPNSSIGKWANSVCFCAAVNRPAQPDPENFQSGEVNQAPNEHGFLFLPKIRGLDGAKVGAVLEAEAGSLTVVENEYRGALQRASTYGGQMALKWTALVPLMMALGYLGLILYFRARGGYRAVSITED